jgi:hypothetical protein
VSYAKNEVDKNIQVTKQRIEQSSKKSIYVMALINLSLKKICIRSPMVYTTRMYVVHELKPFC